MKKRKDWALSVEQRQDAREALAILDGTGITLTQAAQMASGRRRVASIDFGEAVRLFLRDKAAAGLRPSTLQWYQDHLFSLETTFGDRAIASITRSDLSRYFTANPSAVKYRAMRAMIRHGISIDPPWTSEDPTVGIKVIAKKNDSEIGILTLREVASAFSKDSPWRSAWALWLFAGIRPGELHGQGKSPMRWRCVDPVSRIIRIPAECAKTRRTRILEDLPDTVWRHLDPGADSDPIAPSFYLDGNRALQAVTGYMQPDRRTRIREWPHDATRHSFATYHLALCGDPGKTSLLLGHEGSPTLLYRHYRGLATKSEAIAYFAI